MNKFRNRGLFILLTLAAFSILALASYMLSAPPAQHTVDQNDD